MTTSPIIDAPGGFVPEVAITFGARAEPSRTVNRDTPLPVQTGFAPAASTALAGSASASAVLGPFTPDLGRPIWVTLAGDWTGSVTVQRSTDNGTTLRPLTVAGATWANFTGNVQEPIGDESVDGASWWLAFQRTAGTLTYEVRQ